MTVDLRLKTDRDKFLTPQECGEIVALAGRDGSSRDCMLLLLGMNLAPRASELVRLRIQDFDERGRFVRMPTVKRLTALQKKERRDSSLTGERWRKPKLAHGQLPDLYIEIPIAAVIAETLQAYAVKAGTTSWLFPGRREHISTRTAERIFKFWARRAGLSKRVSLHALRHARGVDLYEKGLDLLEIKEFLRHESVTSTGIYQHLSPQRRALLLEKVGSLGIRNPVDVAVQRSATSS